MAAKLLTGDELHRFNPEAHAAMKAVGQNIAEVLKPTGQGFVLLTFGFGPGGRLEYMSNARREDVVRVLEEFVGHLRRDAPGSE